MTTTENSLTTGSKRGNSEKIKTAPSVPRLAASCPPNREKHFTVVETAQYRQNVTLSIAAAYEQSAENEDSPEALALADMLYESASEENIFFAVGMTNDRGERFDAYGSFNSTGTRLDPNYMAKKSSWWNKKIRKSFENQGILDANGDLIAFADGSLKNFPKGCRLRFVTLGMPDLKVDAETDLEILERALTLFKKRDIWRLNVEAGYIGEEFTDGEATYFHWNFHAHALVVSKFLTQSIVSNVWTDCLEKASLEKGVKFDVSHCKNNRVEVWINDVATYARKNEISVSKAISEVSKYLAKGSDITRLPVNELVGLERVLRNRKMIQSYGSFNSQRGKAHKEKIEVVIESPSIYTSPQLTAEKRTPMPTLLRIGAQMIAEGRRDEWKILLNQKMGRRRAFRRQQLAEKHPKAVFYTLSGDRFSSSDFVFSDKPKVSFASTAIH